ncbi:RNase adapter RapZ [Naumannella halotolerans]|uniref:UPF0042 nucleotide-binding protein n=1 Tax=Naumannella halotolerans TaxID=993414 RepID=A0A4R7J6K6_9ACTN|nr:RNase adapter RapZ [Naumannella halotolerans]TDT32845.1 UPF0042 nucleotide-binding protein [Naumannella halotolerans]
MTSELEAAAPRLVVITGMSGAGRRTSAHVLEDLGWYVVDNLPPSMLMELVEKARSSGIDRLAVVLDVRSRSQFDQLPTVFAALAETGHRPELLFMDAEDDVIVRRQSSVRRPHPLQGDGSLLQGIRRERELLAGLRAGADMVIDTSGKNLHQLGVLVANAFGGGAEKLRLCVMSFGFKNGLPLDADFVFDVRFLPNPHWVPDLQPRTGLDPEVRDYVLGQTAARPFLDQVAGLIGTAAQGYEAEGKRYATIAIGCTGGKHRSTAMTEELVAMLNAAGLTAAAVHRDLGRE